MVSSLHLLVATTAAFQSPLSRPGARGVPENDGVAVMKSSCRRCRRRRRPFCFLGSTTLQHAASPSSSPQEQGAPEQEPTPGGKRGKDDEEEEDDEAFLRRELIHLESLETTLDELSGPSSLWDDDLMIWDQSSLDELLGDVPDDDNDDDDEKEKSSLSSKSKPSRSNNKETTIQETAARGLEQALLQGVVPVSAGVGSDSLPGDFGFDPLHLATKDLFRPTQQFLLNLLPSSRWEDDGDDSDSSSQASASPENDKNDAAESRPKALILRDYREAEIRHGRLAMLAAIFWPLQEMLDRFVLSEDQFGPLIYGPVTLPYFPLLMTAIMLLLGYLDIYSQAIKDMDRIGEAFLPGDCFWDPLRILQGTSDRTKRNMQERELFNGRAAMLAFAAYTLEEAVTHRPFIDLENNAILLEPPFTVPFIQRWLDAEFSVTDVESAFLTPSDIGTIGSLLQESFLMLLAGASLPCDLLL